MKKPKVVLCIPTLTRPYEQTIGAIAASVTALDEAGFDHYCLTEVGCPYINQARATMMRKALDAKADMIVFIDHDVSWKPESLVKLLQAEGDYVCGTYRFKLDAEEYMGQILLGETRRPLVREDGAIKASLAPAGFMKLTPWAVHKVMAAHPELCYGARYAPHIDFFNYGPHNFVFWGEDYAACRRWSAMGEDLWLVPDLDLTHHGKDKDYPGNFHEYLLRRPGGAKCNTTA